MLFTESIKKLKKLKDQTESLFYATDECNMKLVSNFYLYFHLWGNVLTVNSMEGRRT